MARRAQKLFNSALFTVLLIFLLPRICLGDTGIPIVILNVSELWLAFIPIVFIEAIIIKRSLQATSIGEALWSSLYVNAITTLVGVPIAYALYTFVGLLGWYALPVSGNSGGMFSKLAYAFLIRMVWGPETELRAYQIIPAILFVPAYFLTVYLEKKILAVRFPHEPSGQIRRLSWQMNLYSYGLLIILAFVLPLIGRSRPH